MATSNPKPALKLLVQCGVDFILVGGVASILQGAPPVDTQDIELVYSLEPLNIDRLLRFLTAVDAIFRVQPQRRLRPDRSHLSAGGHLNLLTSFGPIDFLGFIGNQLRYPDLLPDTIEKAMGDGISIRVLNLETIIAVKEQLNTEKDRATLPILRETLRRQQR